MVGNIIPISTVGGEDLIQGLKIKADWKYRVTGGSTATIDIYGIGNGSSGETLIGTATLDNTDADRRSCIFQYLTHVDYSSIRWEYDHIGTDCKLFSVDFAGYILQVPEDTTNDIVKALT